MPPGLRLPRLHAAIERPDERIVLWLEDADPVETAWSSEDLERAATALGRLTVRRADQVLASLPTGSFLWHLVERGLKPWALPHLRSDALWAHPAFAQREVVALRPALGRLAAEVGANLETTQELAEDRLAELRGERPGRFRRGRRLRRVALDELDRAIVAAGYESLLNVSTSVRLPALVLFLA